MSGQVFAIVWTLGIVLQSLGMVLTMRWGRTGHLPGHCARCGYDLRGLDPSARCPECGAGTERHARRAPPLRPSMLIAPMAVGGALTLLLIPPLFGGGWGIAGLLVSAIPVALSYVAATVVVLVCWGMKRRTGLLAPSIASALTITVVNILVLVDAAVWHPDAQSGIVILMLPIFGVAAGGYGWLPAVLLRRWVELDEATRSPHK